MSTERRTTRLIGRWRCEVTEHHVTLEFGRRHLITMSRTQADELADVLEITLDEHDDAEDDQ